MSAMSIASLDDRPSRTTSFSGRSAEDGHPVRITVEDGRITAVDRVADEPGETWISPGWMDIQINGYEGHDPNAPGDQAEATTAMVRSLWQHGVTASCVTLCTDSEDRILEGLRGIAAACRSDPLIAASVVGIHVEGPSISTEDGPRGAHPLRHVRPPSIAEYRRWQQAAEGRIRIITLSPEYEEAARYIETIVADGVVASIGHTAATSDQIRMAVDAGARWSTHLGNGAHALIPRHPNYIWDQLAEDRLSAGFIFDGHHLPPAVMKSVLRAKGIERSILVSDAVYVAGLPPGRYRLPDGAEVELRASGRLELAGTPYLAGAVTALPTCLANAVRYAGVTLSEAVRMVTANPARLLGLPLSSGRESLRVGVAANLTMYSRSQRSGNVQVERTIVDGVVVYEAPGA